VKLEYDVLIWGEDSETDDVKTIKGELIVLRPSIETCVERSVNRK
jgi:hypothetical protein